MCGKLQQKYKMQKLNYSKQKSNMFSVKMIWSESYSMHSIQLRSHCLIGFYNFIKITQLFLFIKFTNPHNSKWHFVRSTMLGRLLILKPNDLQSFNFSVGYMSKVRMKEGWWNWVKEKAWVWGGERDKCQSETPPHFSITYWKGSLKNQ